MTLRLTNWLAAFLVSGFPLLAHAGDLSLSACSDTARSGLVIGNPGERVDLFPSYPPECQSTDSKECRAKGYLIPQDVVSVHTVCAGWAYVTFTNKKLQRSAGWIDSTHLSSAPLVPVRELAEQARATLAELNKAKGIEGSKNHDTCSIVVDYANRGVWERFKVQPDKCMKRDDVQRLFGEDAIILMGGCGDYWLLDLNGDSTLEDVLMFDQGTAHIGVGYVRSEKNRDSEPQALPSEGSDISLIKIGKQYFFASGEDGKLAELWRFRTDGSFERVCAFHQRAQPVTRLIYGKQRPVCASVLADQVRAVDFPQRPLEKMTSPKSLITGMSISTLANRSVKLDIGNDGHKRNVTLLSTSGSGGRGCDTTQVVTTDDAGEEVPANKLNSLLAELRDEQLCWSQMNVFVHQRATYIDEQVRDGDRTIYQIRDNAVHIVCKFERQFILEVADPSEVAR